MFVLPEIYDAKVKASSVNRWDGRTILSIKLLIVIMSKLNFSIHFVCFSSSIYYLIFDAAAADKKHKINNKLNIHNL